MPSGTVKHDGEHGVGKPLNHVAGLQAVLAVAVGREPPGCGVVDKRIVEDLSHLVAEGGHIAEASPEKAWRDPARIVHHVTPLAKAVIGTAWLEVIGVEPEDAAVVWVTAD